MVVKQGVLTILPHTLLEKVECRTENSSLVVNPTGRIEDIRVFGQPLLRNLRQVQSLIKALPGFCEQP